MKRQAIVVGLGQFGMAVARALTDAQVEVFAIDIDEDKVTMASMFVSEAAVIDGMDEQALSRTSPSRRDFCVCAIGDEAKDASIICTALLRQLGAKRVVSRANDDLHARILRLVGAENVVNPEREFGERFAKTLLHSQIKGQMPLGQGLWITDFSPPDAFVGRTLIELELPRRFGITVVAVRKGDSGEIVMPRGDAVTEVDDVLIVVSQAGAVSAMLERV